MGSTRLPGKPLLQVLGKPLLYYLLSRLKQLSPRAQVALLTTREPADAPLVALAQELEVAYFRGSEHDVLARYAQAAIEGGFRTVVRITADCPLLDPALVAYALDLFEEGSFDYLSNAIERTYPRGMDIELFSTQALLRAYHEAVAPEEREHVTPYLWRRPELFRLGQFRQERDLSAWRWTVDTEEDFSLVAPLLASAYALSPLFGLEELVAIAESHPDWMVRNASVMQKSL